MKAHFLRMRVSALILSAWVLAWPAGKSSWRQTPFEVGPLRALPGHVVSGLLQVPPGRDPGTRIPVSVINGSAEGPVLALIAGNHGCEYPPILATERLLTRIDPVLLKGTVILVHVANMPSFLRRTIYYSPIDGKNLNRVYPGRQDGTVCDRIAWVVTHEVIERSDYVVDMHCGDGNESLRPFAYWEPIGNPKVDEPAKQMLLAFGIPNIVIDRSDPTDPGASRYCANTGSTRGKPSITIESGGKGEAYLEQDTARVEQGALNLMRHLKMLDGPARMAESVTWYEPSGILSFPTNLPDKEGLFFPRVDRGRTVGKGDLIGIVTDFFGKKIFEARAPFSGEVLYVIATPPISAGEPLAFIGSPKK